MSVNSLENKAELEKCGISSVCPGDLIHWDGIGFEVEEKVVEGRYVRVYIGGVGWRTFSGRKIVFVTRVTRRESR